MFCSNVCPVKIGIHEQIYKLRQELIRKGYGSLVKEVILKISGFVFARPVLYDVAGKMGVAENGAIWVDESCFFKNC